MKMNIKIDPKVVKIGFTALGMGLTYLGSMITNNIQQKDQKEAMVKIAKEIVKEELKHQAKRS